MAIPWQSLLLAVSQLRKRRALVVNGVEQPALVDLPKCRRTGFLGRGHCEIHDAGIIGANDVSIWRLKGHILGERRRRSELW